MSPSANKLAARVNEGLARNLYLGVGEARSVRLDAPLGGQPLEA
jgi:hypothetical protein